MLVLVVVGGGGCVVLCCVLFRLGEMFRRRVSNVECDSGEGALSFYLGEGASGFGQHARAAQLNSIMTIIIIRSFLDYVNNIPWAPTLAQTQCSRIRH